MSTHLELTAKSYVAIGTGTLCEIYQIVVRSRNLTLVSQGQIPTRV